MKRAFALSAKIVGVLLALPYAVFVIAIPWRGTAGAGIFFPVAFPALFVLMYHRSNIHDIEDTDILQMTPLTIVLWWFLLALFINVATKPTKFIKADD